MTEPEDRPLFSPARWDESLGVLALVTIVLAILWGVVSRYLLPQPAAWTYEIATLAFAYLVFFGAVAGVRLGSHAAVDVLVDRFPMGARRAVAWFNYLLLAALFAVMTALFLIQAYVSRNAHTVALDLPRSLYYAPLALASFGMFVQHLRADRPWKPDVVTRHVDPIL